MAGRAMPISSGGTGQTTAGGARIALGLRIGSAVQAYDPDLTAYAGLSTAGLVTRTGDGTAASRTITGTSNEITVTDGAGTAGNPTLSLPNALTFTGKTVTGGVFNVSVGSNTNPSYSFTGDTNTGFYSVAADAIGVAIGGTLITAFDVDGIATTNLSIAGGQIAFPATVNPSADANTLDDYEEGTWTPTIIGSTAAGSGTYSVQTGTYTKIGNMVFVQGTTTWSAHTGTGNLRIGTLPFTTGSGVDQAAGISQSALTYTSYIQARFKAATTYLELTQAATNAAEAIIAIEAAGSIWIAGGYHI